MCKHLTCLGGVAGGVMLAALLVTSLAFAYSADFENVPEGPIDGLVLPGMTFAGSEYTMVVEMAPLPPDIEFTHVSGHVAVIYSVDELNGWVEITFDEPQNLVSFGYLYIQFTGEPTLAQAAEFDVAATSELPSVRGELDGQEVYHTTLSGQYLFGDTSSGWYGGTVTLNGLVDRIRVSSPTFIMAIDSIETGIVLEEPEAAAPMSCTTGDNSLNARHCGRPVAIFAQNGGFAIYGVDINTGWGSLASTITAGQIDEVGIPTDGPVVVAEGQNPYNHQPFTLYRLPGGEFQLNTYYWNGKPYAVKWEGTDHVKVVTW